MVNNATIIYHNMVALLTIKWLIRAHGEGELKFKSCNLHFGWNGDLNFNIRDVEFSLYSFNLFKVTSSSNDAISTAFIAISNSYDKISTWIV